VRERYACVSSDPLSISLFFRVFCSSRFHAIHVWLYVESSTMIEPNSARGEVFQRVYPVSSSSSSSYVVWENEHRIFCFFFVFEPFSSWFQGLGDIGYVSPTLYYNTHIFLARFNHYLLLISKKKKKKNLGNKWTMMRVSDTSVSPFLSSSSSLLTRWYSSIFSIQKMRHHFPPTRCIL
jgi:hypothetical protein